MYKNIRDLASCLKAETKPLHLSKKDLTLTSVVRRKYGCFVARKLGSAPEGAGQTGGRHVLDRRCVMRRPVFAKLVCTKRAIPAKMLTLKHPDKLRAPGGLRSEQIQPSS